jgi:predicted flap endonuclease-1-like 5' DNA nuclease
MMVLVMPVFPSESFCTADIINVLNRIAVSGLLVAELSPYRRAIYEKRKGTMPAQEKLSPTEQYLAYIAGFGILVAITALILIGLGTISNNNGVGLLLVGLALIVIGIGGWLIMLRPWEKFDDLKTPYYTGHEEHAAAPVEAAAPAEVAAPVPETAGSEEADDLTLIEGVGPKSAEALKASGIATFAQVAKLSPAELEKAVKDQDVRLVGTAEHWPRQAEIAATGDLTALEDYQRRMKGGTVVDDLTLIEGVGPKSAEALKATGITTFAQVAKLSPAELEKAIKDRKVRLVGSTETWPMQAELAAKGDLSALEALQARIKTGGVLEDKE